MTDKKAAENRKVSPLNGQPVPAGRPPGCTNKISRVAKDNIAKVFDGMGGVKGMIRWAKKSSHNQEIFYRDIYSKIIALDVEHGGGLSHVLCFDFGNGNGENGKTSE